jgi:uncharacterized membrane protein YdjX (TVP38/TMEM64 family)
MSSNKRSSNSLTPTSANSMSKITNSTLPTNNYNLSTPRLLPRSCSPIIVIRIILLLMLVTGLIVGSIFFDQLKSGFLSTLQYCKQLGPINGSIALIISNIIGALLFLPCLPFTLGAGFLYGTLFGSILISLASTLAAILAFLCARYLARRWVENSISRKGSKFRILDNAIASDGFKIVFLIRCSPVHPYGLCNYLFGLTSVSFRDYSLASAIGMLPSTIMEVYYGASFKDITDIISGNLEQSTLSRVIFWASLVITTVATAAITMLLKRKLRDELTKYQPENSPHGASLSLEDLMSPDPDTELDILSPDQTKAKLNVNLNNPKQISASSATLDTELQELSSISVISRSGKTSPFQPGNSLKASLSNKSDAAPVVMDEEEVESEADESHEHDRLLSSKKI